MALLAVACWYWFNRERSSAPREEDPIAHPEPHAPHWLELKVIEEDAAEGRLTAEILVTPGVNAAAELEILSPPGLALGNGASKRALTLRRGQPVLRERVEVRAATGKSAVLRVELRVLDEQGRPTLSITEEKTLNQPPPAAPARVPVVRVLPDGSRIVEYVPTNAPAARRP